MRKRPKQVCSICGLPSIPGLANGQGKCQFHWDKGCWGIDWASKCHPEHPEAIKVKVP